MVIVITTCTNRKRKPIPDALRACWLTPGDLASAAKQWGMQLCAQADRFPANEVYGGRAFQDVRHATQKIQGRMLIVSAGLGLVDASTLIPAYACTVIDDAPDSISARVKAGYSRAGWWRELKRVSPFHLDLTDIAAGSNALIIAALSDNYIELISEDLLALPDERLANLRLLTRTPVPRVPAKLRDYVMPYDDRLDGQDSPIKGTRSDFAARALRHFVEAVAIVQPSASAQVHATSVRKALEDWSYPKQVDRERLDDDEIVRLLKAHWESANGSTSKLLRLFRDTLNVACEQGRFAALARQVRAERS